MKKKSKKKNSLNVKSLDLTFFKKFSENTIKRTKKKMENYLSNYQKQRAKDKIENERRLKAERKKEILK